MKGAFSSVALRFQARNERRRIAFGSLFLRLLPGGASQEYTAIIMPIEDEEIADLLLQGQENVMKREPHHLELLPLDCPLQDGDFILWPVGSDPSVRRFRVVNRPTDKFTQGVQIKRSAVMLLDTEKQP